MISILHSGFFGLLPVISCSHIRKMLFSIGFVVCTMVSLLCIRILGHPPALLFLYTGLVGGGILFLGHQHLGMALLAGAVSFMGFVSTDFAYSIPGLERSVFGTELMPLVAVSSFCILGRRGNASQDILAAGNGFKMVGVAAGLVPTEVVDMKPPRYGTLDHLIGHSMDMPVLSFYPDGSVPPSGGRELPAFSIGCLHNSAPRLNGFYRPLSPVVHGAQCIEERMIKNNYP